ncbi:hypothetical protein B1757_13180 [Acidithiobacillus marinus]|uniref:TraD/TraG TraM recognition site domain-containing protein n=1 Tax=Acidithiobacillus marinus TaxID=187490 RepID=A0A2I1DIQ1_9PROT|nr:TraM recognition domain-containing protein [Acidithiobacillus marinus]PKY09747.1 hypothetical protein B1757_13180 [Acidithiobacillus marinus]
MGTTVQDVARDTVNNQTAGILQPKKRAAIKRYLEDFFERRVLGSDLYGEYDVRYGDPLFVDDQGSVRHELAMGKSGAGKTVYLVNKALGQIRRGGGVGVIESKSDYEFRDMTMAMCDAYGRSLDFRCVNIDNAKESNTYSPWNRGGPDVCASRVTGTVETGGNPSAEHFKEMAHSALQATIGAIKHLGLSFNALDLYILLNNPNAMSWLEERVKSRGVSEAATLYTMHLDSYRSMNKEGVLTIDLARMRQQIGGVANRLYPYGIGDMGEVLNPYSAEVDLLRGHDESHIMFFMTPELEKSETAKSFAKILFSDLRSVIAQMYRRRDADKLDIPYRWLFDEFGSYASRQITTPLEMMRGSRIGATMFFQASANLVEEPLGETFRSKIFANTDIKTFLPLGDPESMEYAADFCADALQNLKMQASGVSHAKGNKNLDFDIFHNISESATDSMTLKEQYDYRVRPTEFRDLEIGQAIIAHGKHIMKVRFPEVILPNGIPPFSLERIRTPYIKGLDMREMYDAAFSLEKAVSVSA